VPPPFVRFSSATVPCEQPATMGTQELGDYGETPRTRLSESGEGWFPQAVRAMDWTGRSLYNQPSARSGETGRSRWVQRVVCRKHLLQKTVRERTHPWHRGTQARPEPSEQNKTDLDRVRVQPMWSCIDDVWSESGVVMELISCSCSRIGTPTIRTEWAAAGRISILTRQPDQ